MRDPLIDLVRRTRRPESTVQPRLPSAYETSRQTTHELAVDDEHVTRESDATHLPISTRDHTPPASAPVPRERHDSPAIVATAMRVIPPAEDTVDHARRPAPPAAPASPDTVPHRAVQVTTVMEPRREFLPVDPAAQASVPRMPATEAAPRETRLPQAIAAIQPVTRVDLAQVHRMGVQPARQDSLDTREHAAPDIRISIGRIEVRATPSERPPARRQPSSAPPLTLDDYLAARARRGTR